MGTGAGVQAVVGDPQTLHRMTFDQVRWMISSRSASLTLPYQTLPDRSQPWAVLALIQAAGLVYPHQARERPGRDLALERTQQRALFGGIAATARMTQFARVGADEDMVVKSGHAVILSALDRAGTARLHRFAPVPECAQTPASQRERCRERGSIVERAAPTPPAGQNFAQHVVRKGIEQIEHDVARWKVVFPGVAANRLDAVALLPRLGKRSMFVRAMASSCGCTSTPTMRANGYMAASSNARPLPEPRSINVNVSKSTVARCSHDHGKLFFRGGLIKALAEYLPQAH